MNEFDSVRLIVPRGAETLVDSALPDEEGLLAGDTGVIVDAAHAPYVYTVEFFRDGETVAIADVVPHEVAVIEGHALAGVPAAD